MAESSSQISQQQDPHEQPETPPPFEPTPQVGFDIGEITFNPNNEVALLHPLHDNNKYFKLVSDFISKYGEAVEAKGTLKKSLLPPRVNIDFARLIWEDLITKLNKKTREKVFPYLRFLSLLLEHNMEGYGYENVTLNPTQVFGVHNWTLKKNQPEGPPFTNHMLTICKAELSMEHKAPNTSSYTRKKDSKGKKLGAKSRHMKQPTSSKHQPLSKIKATKGVTNEGGDNPQLSSGMSASIHNKPIYSDSTIIHSDFALEHDVSAKSKAGADSVFYAPKDLIPPSTSNDAGPNKPSLYHIFAGRVQHSPDLSSSVDTQKDIKLEDLSKMVQDVDFDFMDLDSPKDDEPIIIQDESNEEVHAEKSQNQKLEKLKSQAEAEVAFLTVQPSFSNVEQLTKLLVKSLKPEMSTLLTSRDFSKSLPTKLKELPSKFNDLSGEIK
ncbi:hypothetical protein Tco_1238749 [Tanacetum coccineum]